MPASKHIPQYLLAVTFYLVAASPLCAQQPTPAQNGKAIFERKCATCHGKTGTKGMLGAKNLRTSVLTDTELATIITNGKRIMPSWRNTVNGMQLANVIAYIKTLRN